MPRPKKISDDSADQRIHIVVINPAKEDHNVSNCLRFVRRYLDRAQKQLDENQGGGSGE